VAKVKELKSWQMNLGLLKQVEVAIFSISPVWKGISFNLLILTFA
jgi:hypothetical protein